MAVHVGFGDSKNLDHSFFQTTVTLTIRIMALLKSPHPSTTSKWVIFIRKSVGIIHATARVRFSMNLGMELSNYDVF